MNQTRSHSISKKLLSLILAMIMVLSLMPMTVFAQEDGEPVQQEQLDAAQSAQNGEDTQENGDADTYAATENALKNRIVHLDCGRKYFSVDYINGIIDTMAANGFNQLELAFGNGGLRFVLDDMDIKNGSSTLHNSEDVKAAIREGNQNFYNDPNGNALTETEMKKIIAHANEKGIEIVPLLNMPGHMDGLLSSSLFSQYKLSGSEGSLDLNNSYAVDFGKALLKLYVDWFLANSTSTMYFNFGADEYGQEIQNPYIESSVAKVTYNQLINYMNDCAAVIEGQGLTARCFNDFVCYNKRTDCNLYKTVQVCYWSNQWNGSEYNTPDAIQNAGYKMINTNQKWYFVPSKAGEYGKNVVLNNFQTFDVTKYQNIKSDCNSTSTTYTKVPVGTTNVGAMFCVWCDTPSVDVSLTDVQELIAAMAAANPTYFKQSTVVDPDPETPVIKLGDDTVGTEGLALTTGVNTTLSLSGDATAEWTSSDEEVLKLQAVSATRAAVTSANAVEVIPVAAGTATITAKLDEGGTELTVQATVQEPGTVPITVAVGGTYDVVVIKEKDLSGTYTADPAGIVKITAAGKQVTGDPTYDPITALTADKYYASSAKNAAAPSVELTFESAGNDQYYIKNASGAYVYPDATYSYGGYRWTYSSKASSSKQAVNVKFNGDGSVTVSKSVTNRRGGSTTAYLTISGSDLSGSGSTSKIYLYKKTDHEAGYQTTISFKGLNPGKATVKIGDVNYVITVTERDLTKETIDVEFWITDGGVVPTGWSTGTPTGFTYQDCLTLNNWTGKAYIKVSAAQYGFHAEEGVDLHTALLGNNLTGTVTAGNKDGTTTTAVDYWKTAYHDSSVRQETEGWTNHTHEGVEFQYLRYWDNTWAYSTDRVKWVPVSNISATDTTANQINIIYRQPTTITDEVSTKVVDWGPIETEAYWGLLDFAVVYPSSTTRKPNSFPVDGKTMGFNRCEFTNNTQYYGYDNGAYRYVYGIAGVETANYEVYMITATNYKDTHTSSDYLTYSGVPSSYTYSGDEVVLWASKQADADKAADNGMTVSDNLKTAADTDGEPYLESVRLYDYQALLITYYLRAKPTEDSLTVHYCDRTANDQQFYAYDINVTSYEDNPVLFDPDICLNPDNWKGDLLHATITNDVGKEQTVSADLSTMPDIDAKYRRAVNYECVEVKRSDDGKDVYLYYKFSNTKTFVVDFGLPISIKLSDISNFSDVDITGVTIEKVTYGSAEYDSSQKAIIYKPNKMINTTETMMVKVTGRLGSNQESSVDYTIYILPATTVYYEDSFVTFNNGAGAAAGATWSAAGKTANATPNQLLEELGKKTNPYGYDDAYNNCTTFSMGSAQKVTVSKDMANVYETTSGSAWPTATFTFRGTGFDIISLTDNTSGTFFVTVTKDDGTVVRRKTVNTYYGYKQSADGTWAASPNEPNALYQIPVMRIFDLDYATYTVKIQVAYAKFLDEAGNGSYNFWLDAIRVYDPLGKDNAIYNTEGENEGYPQYIGLHNELVNKKATSNALFIDGAENATVVQYTNYGPNNEVYLAAGQAISFMLTGDLDKIATVQIGAKAPMESTTAKMTVNNTVIPENGLSSATEMYYDITNQAKGGALVKIVNTGANILSLTNLKITYTVKGEVTLATLTDTQQNEAVMAVRALFTTPVEPEPTPDPEPVTFEPSRFEASWGRSVRAGQKATLTVKTSEDVESITVNGETVSAYSTRTERSGWGWWAKKVTYREFTYTVTATATADYTVIAQNGDGAVSQPITATLTVRGGSSWWGSIFDRWF